MFSFGDKSIFSIEYYFKDNPYNEVGNYGGSWGVLKVWIHGREVCQFIKNEITCDYEWNLMDIFEWFSENLKHITNDDPMLLPINGGDSLEIISVSNDYLVPLEYDELDEAAEIQQNWQFRHSWYSARAGSFLAEIYFRLVQPDKIEIAWDNYEIYLDYGIKFTNPKGLYFVNAKYFEGVITSFLRSFIDELVIVHHSE